MNGRTRGAAILACSLLVAGCSSAEQGDKPGGDPKEAVLTVARTYMDAANRDDWKTACGLMSARYRHGSVDDCVTTHNDKAPEPSPSAKPGSGRADIDPAEASTVVEVPAVDPHPAGYGVMVTYAYTWPGKPPESSRLVMRLISEGGAWVVDQREGVRSKHMARNPEPASLVRSMLTAGG